MRFIATALLTALGTLPFAAQASELGAASSGAITVRIEIPPFAAALQAQSEGAVGIWTVTDSKSPLMISLPASVDSSGTTSATVFHGSDMPIAVSVDSGVGVALKSLRPTPMNGLTREAFSLTGLPCPVDLEGTPRAATLLVSAL